MVFAGVEALHFSAENGTALQRRIQHTWHFDVDTKRGLSAHLSRRIHALLRLADQLELRGIFQSNVLLRNRKFSCSFSKTAEADPLVCPDVENSAVFSAALRFRHVPFLSSRLNQHLAGRSAGFAQGFPGRAHTHASKNALHGSKRDRIDTREFGTDLFPVALEFLGKQHRQ